MMRPMFGRQPRPRKFDLPLRYYDPAQDERRRQRVRIDAGRNRRPNQPMRVVSMAVLLGLIVWFISRF
jgi:hypothetical protein